MATKHKSKSTPSIRDVRSINIPLDINTPERLFGYVPTRKSVSLSREIFNSLLGNSSVRAFSAAAPYGSGKSSAGLLWALMAENGTQLPHELKGILDVLRKNEHSDEVNPF